MVHGVHTKHVDSTKTYYQLKHNSQVAGETQGKDYVACIWSVMSHTLLRAHSAIHNGIELKSINSKQSIVKNTDAFIDDCNGVASKQQCTARESKDATRTHLQNGAQLWADLINVTGGAIAFHKSGWQMLAIDDTSFPPTVNRDPGGNIWLKDAFGCKAKITKMSSYTPNKGLQCRQSVDGNMNKEYKFRIGQCRQLSSKVQSARISKTEASGVMSGRSVPSVTYSMPITPFSKKQCKTMNTAINQITLKNSKCTKICPNM